MKNTLALVVAVILGILAVWAGHEWLKRKQETVQTQNPTVRVLVAKKAIDPGTPLTAEVVALEPVSQNSVSHEHILESRVTDFFARKIMRRVSPGEPIFESYFEREAPTLQRVLRDGQRAVTLGVDNLSGVGGNLVPNSHVDILGTFPVAAKGTSPASAVSSGGASQTVLLLSNVTVLAVDNTTREMALPTTGPGSMRRAGYSSVTLAVTPEEANMLVFAQQYGQVTLTLRTQADAALSKPEVVTAQNVLDLATRLEAERQRQLGLTPAEGFIINGTSPRQ